MCGGRLCSLGESWSTESEGVIRTEPGVITLIDPSPRAHAHKLPGGQSETGADTGAACQCIKGVIAVVCVCLVLSLTHTWPEEAYIYSTGLIEDSNSQSAKGVPL